MIAVVLACLLGTPPTDCTAETALDLRHVNVALHDCGTAIMAPVAVDYRDHYAWRLLRTVCTPQRASRAALN